jgi:ubiquinone/menaquinone biosynthesis C-methylase UbiE
MIKSQNIIKSAIFSCNCESYPIINGILLFQNSKIKKIALIYLRIKLHLKLRTYQNSNKFVILTFLINIFGLLRLFRYILKRIVYKIGYQKMLKIITFNSNLNNRWYFINREKLPSYFFYQLFSTILKNNTLPIVDICCGTGQILQYLSNKYPSTLLFGIDKSIIYLLLARIFIVKSNILLIHSNLDDGLPFIDNCVSFLSMVDCMNLINRRDSIVLEIYRVINLCGKLLIINIPNQVPSKKIIKIKPELMKNIIKKTGFKYVYIYNNMTILQIIIENKSLNTTYTESKKIIDNSIAYTILASKTSYKSSLSMLKDDQRIFLSSKMILSF